MTEYLARAAYHELLDLMRDVDAQCSWKGIARVTDEVSVAEGYRFLTDALPRPVPEIYLRSDALPAFVPIVGPTFKWGGDNSDAFDNFAPVAPDLSTACTAKRGDAVYLSVCVYGGPDDGRWSTRIVSNLNDREHRLRRRRELRDRRFPRATGRRAELARGSPTTHAMVTRDYHIDPVHGRRPSTRSKRSPPTRRFRRSATRKSRGD